MNEDMYGVEIYDDTYESLYHAGKKGMKWGFNDGKRNGNRIAEMVDTFRDNWVSGARDIASDARDTYQRTRMKLDKRYARTQRSRARNAATAANIQGGDRRRAMEQRQRRSAGKRTADMRDSYIQMIANQDAAKSARKQREAERRAAAEQRSRLRNSKIANTMRPTSTNPVGSGATPYEIRRAMGQRTKNSSNQQKLLSAMAGERELMDIFRYRGGHQDEYTKFANSLWMPDDIRSAPATGKTSQQRAQMRDAIISTNSFGNVRADSHAGNYYNNPYSQRIESTLNRRKNRK